jgi:FkbM family methyltransferase
MSRWDPELFFLRVRKLAFAFRSRLTLNALAHGVAASIEHTESLSRYKFSTIVDVGANRGQFALFSIEYFPDARIICFEPIPDATATFRRIFSGYHNVIIHQFAIGSEPAEARLHVTAADDSSSMLSISQRQRDAFGTYEQTTIMVPVHRLDETIPESAIVAPALLKIDVQGYELEVLRGCGALLTRFDVVYVEASYVELYREQHLADDILEFLFMAGFTLCGVFNQAVYQGRPLQVDFLLGRKVNQQAARPVN